MTISNVITASGEIWFGVDIEVEQKLKSNCRDYDEDYGDDECKKSDRMGLETVFKKFGSTVDNCCEFDGYVEEGTCDAKDKQVN